MIKISNATLRSRMFKLSAIFTVILLIVGFCYKPALENGFINWDDHAYVTENKNIQSLTQENLYWMLISSYLGNWHPLTWGSHALDYAAFGLQPWGHHLTNVIFHLLNTLLVGILVIALMSWHSSTSIKENSNNHLVLLAAAMAALLFGIHPQNVESVAWIAERKNVLSQFFLLLGLLCYGFYVKASSIKIKYYSYLATLSCFILALMSKPIAVVFPLILILIDIYPFHRTSLTISPQSGKVTRYFWLILEKVPFLLLSLVVGVATILAQHTSGFVANIQHVSISIRLLNAANSSLFYLSKFLFPIGLSPFYPLSNIPTDYHHYFVPVVGFFLITSVCGYLWYKRSYEWLSAWLFYLITLLPVIGLIQVGSQAAADRYAYLSILPCHILAGIGIAKLFYLVEFFKKSIQTAVIGMILLLTISLTQLTQQQIKIWNNDLRFWSYIVISNPDNVLGQVQLGNAYFEAGHYQKALAHYLLVKSLTPYHSFYQRLVMTYIELGQLDAALEFCHQVLAQRREPIAEDEVYTLMGQIHIKQGNLSQAQVMLEKALLINPGQTVAKKLLENSVGCVINSRKIDHPPCQGGAGGG